MVAFYVGFYKLKNFGTDMETVFTSEKPTEYPIGLIVFSMAVCSFAIGVTEFVTTGLLPDLAADFHISIPTAGFVTSGYALGVGIGGPILTILTISLSRRRVLTLLMLMFIIGSIISALATSFIVLMVGRFISAFCHGAFFGIGSVVVSSMVKPDKKASAIALMFTGLTLANVIGVPAGTLIGQLFGWRMAFWIISILGIVGFIGVFVSIPIHIGKLETNMRKELAVFKRLSVWMALLVTAMGFSGLLASFAYVAPLMIHVAGYTEHSVVWLLSIYGIGLVMGNILGGKAADKALMPTIYTLLGLLVCLLLLFTFTAHIKLLAAITLLLLGAVGFGTVSPLQMYIMKQAGDAPTLASSANISAFNLGTALGVFVAGIGIHSGLGFVSVNWIGALLSLSGLMLLFISNYFKRFWEYLRNTE